MGTGETDAGFLVLRIVRGFRRFPAWNARVCSAVRTLRRARDDLLRPNRRLNANGSGAGIAKILGNAMAHELGHVLLGSPQHFPSGIRPLEFLPDEAVPLGDAVFRRAAAPVSGPQQPR